MGHDLLSVLVDYRHNLNFIANSSQPELEAERASPLFANNALVTSMLSKSNRIALFIDGANLHATARTLGFDIDFKRLLKEFEGRKFCCARSTTRQSSKIRNIPRSARNRLAQLQRLHRSHQDGEGVHGRRRSPQGQRRMHVELAVDAIDLAGQIDQMVLFSGDEDFRPLSRQFSVAASALR